MQRPVAMDTLLSGLDQGSSRAGTRALLARLVGAGDRIMLVTLPFALVGIAANVLWPSAFSLRLGRASVVLGQALLAVGIPLWFTSAVQILVLVPRATLITRGPFALVRHPLYTSVALLVVPGVGLLFGSWLGAALGLVLYVASRRYAPAEERELETRFPKEYAAYRKRVLLPWL